MENKVMRYLPLYRGPRDFGDPFAFGYRLPFFCDRCQAPRTASLTRLVDQDGVGLFYTCDMCGSDRIGPHDDPKPYRRTRSMRLRLTRIVERRLSATVGDANVLAL